MAKQSSSKRTAAGSTGKSSSSKATKPTKKAAAAAPARKPAAKAAAAAPSRPQTSGAKRPPVTAGGSAKLTQSSSSSASRGKAPAAVPVGSAGAPRIESRVVGVGSANHAPPPQPMARPMTTTDKPRKNQAGLGAKELEHFRQLLLEKRREIVGDMSSMEREALRTSGGTNLSNLPMHMADMGTDNYEQEFTLGLVEKDRMLLREINTALGKIQDGTYGICEGTGKPISKVRLEAQPWARHSIEYARQKERGLVR